jgi:hypothetical protein
VLNAIAKDDKLAEMGELRPTTRNVTFYGHHNVNWALINEAVNPDEDRIEPHYVETLRQKIIIDAPDFDSTVRKNRERLREILEIADLVICTATAEKYKDESLFTILAEFEKLKAFVFLANKIDQADYKESVREDFTEHLSDCGFREPRILAVSARHALKNRLLDKVTPEEGEFTALEDIIKVELDKAQIKKIKEKNIHNLVDHVIGQISACLPDNPRKAVSEWVESVGARGPELLDILEQKAGSLPPHLHGDFAAYIKRLNVLRFSGPYGWYISGVESIKSLLRFRSILSAKADLYSIEEDLIAKVRKNLEDENVEVPVRKIVGQASAALKDRGVYEDAFLKHVPDYEGENSITRNVSRIIGDAIRVRLAEPYTRAAEARWYSFRNLSYNFLPLGFIGYTVYKLVDWYIKGLNANAKGKFIEGSFVIHSLLILLMIFVVQHIIWGYRDLERDKARLERSLQREIAGKLSEYIENLFNGPVSETASELNDAISIFESAAAGHERLKNLA